MIGAIILFLIPVGFFVTAFLYETYISFKRIFRPNYSRRNYVSATWEITHTLLIFAVVMLLMMFTQVLSNLSSEIFLSTFLASLALCIRAILYIYIFYVKNTKKINWSDWMFAVSHLLSAGFLVITVLRSLWFIYKNDPPVNSQFIPYFIPGLLLVLGLCLIPMLTIYKTKD